LAKIVIKLSNTSKQSIDAHRIEISGEDTYNI
jgi:hypothetical protein